MLVLPKDQVMYNVHRTCYVSLPGVGKGLVIQCANHRKLLVEQPGPSFIHITFATSNGVRVGQGREVIQCNALTIGQKPKAPSP